MSKCAKTCPQIDIKYFKLKIKHIKRINNILLILKYIE